MLGINTLPLAEEDLINIWIYGYETWGAAQADAYLDGMDAALNSLAYFPRKHRLRKNFRPPVRICHYASHLIIFVIDGDAISIIRVLHKSMDIEQHF